MAPDQSEKGPSRPAATCTWTVDVVLRPSTGRSTRRPVAESSNCGLKSVLWAISSESTPLGSLQMDRQAENMTSAGFKVSAGFSMKQHGIFDALAPWITCRAQPQQLRGKLEDELLALVQSDK